MRARDILGRLDDRFAGFYAQMKRFETVLAREGDEQLRIVQYTTRGERGFPLEKVTFLVLENGWVWNKDDRTLLDENEIVAGAFVPVDALPLPMLILEVSIHIAKYDHLNVDLFPLSKDPQYQGLFCRPLEALRKKNDDLPGLLKGTVNPGLLDAYTSGGMLCGDIPVAFRPRSMPWFYEYVELYHGLLCRADSYPILKDPAVVEEGRKIKSVFLSNFNRETPRILEDIPHLYSREKGRELGDYLF